MDSATAMAAHIVRLMRGSPGVAWELVPPSAAERRGDVDLRAPDGALLAYARPVLGEPRATPSHVAQGAGRQATS
jgi:hypothetical protein